MEVIRVTKRAWDILARDKNWIERALERFYQMSADTQECYLQDADRLAKKQEELTHSIKGAYIPPRMREMHQNLGAFLSALATFEADQKPVIPSPLELLEDQRKIYIDLAEAKARNTELRRQNAVLEKVMAEYRSSMTDVELTAAALAMRVGKEEVKTQDEVAELQSLILLPYDKQKMIAYDGNQPLYKRGVCAYCVHALDNLDPLILPDDDFMKGWNDANEVIKL